MKKLSFVIPCYCSEKSIKKVVDDIIKTVENDGRYTYEIICVNDCSKDDTYSVLVDLAHNSKVKVLNMAKNFGQHSALMAGFNEVTGDIVVCLDDDGQNHFACSVIVPALIQLRFMKGSRHRQTMSLFLSGNMRRKMLYTWEIQLFLVTAHIK